MKTAGSDAEGVPQVLGVVLAAVSVGGGACV